MTLALAKRLPYLLVPEAPAEDGPLAVADAEAELAVELAVDPPPEHAASPAVPRVKVTVARATRMRLFIELVLCSLEYND